MSIIRLEHVSKRFTLRHDRPRSLQELFLNTLHLKSAPRRERFWVLRDINLEVEPGEMVGVIGPNGAGKSTLLKLLSRIFEPTSGQIEINGRVGALLELGAGFHPDLTGRENVYLNGSILGFSRAEMSEMYEDIVRFSEMERFIDIPMRQYSSGMFMRLGFSVAIHLRPDILLVDEVLAVGDETFQRRCLDRIEELKREGAAIVFVTHDLRTVRTMCDRALWLDRGHIQAEGNVERVIDAYMSHIYATEDQAVRRGGADGQDETSWRWGSHEAEIVRVQFLDEGGREARTFETGQTFIARLHYIAHEQIEHPVFGVALHHADGLLIAGPNTGSASYPIDTIEGSGHIDFVIPRLPFLQGTYLFSVALYDREGKHAFDHHHQAYAFHVAQLPQEQELYGSFHIQSRWELGSSFVAQSLETRAESTA